MSGPPRRRPKIGDILDVKPVRVSGNDNILGENPLKWGEPFVRIQKENLDKVLPEDFFEALNTASSPFDIGYEVNAYPSEVVGMDSGSIIVRILPEKSRSTEDDSEPLFETPQREESLDVEWEGTSQKRDSERIERRKEALDGDDLRGSKNDLL